MKKTIYLFLSLLLFILSYPYAFALTQISERVDTVENISVQTKLEPEDFRLAGSKNTDIDFWKQVLPDIDKNRDKYLVIPGNGLVIPIGGLKKGTTEYMKAIQGKNFDYKSILDTGVLEYPGTGGKGYGKSGNKVLFGHSSYFKYSSTRYKTHFQKIIELDKGEEIWIFEKQNDGTYKRFVYVVQDFYNTSPYDVNIMKSSKESKLTLITCTPIGNLTGRWVVKAILKEDTSEPTYSGTPKSNFWKYKLIIDIKLKKILNSNESEEYKRVLLRKIDQYISKKYKTSINVEIKNALMYFKEKIKEKLK